MNVHTPITCTSEVQQLASKLVDELVGTCDRMPDWVEEHEQEQAIMEFFDQDAFCCNHCGWWWDISEAEENPDGDGNLCRGCANE